MDNPIPDIQTQCKLSFLHFNDVYDIQPDAYQPKGGAAYFKVLLDQYRKTHTLTLFSGDAFAPSLLSSQHKGQNMIKPLNSFQIDLACLGNHDLDYPLDHVKELKDATNFPWLLSNVYNKLTGTRLVDCEQYRIMQKDGYKIGFFGLAQKQWIETLIPSYKQILEYIPWQQFTVKMIQQLQAQGCNLIVAVTHMMRYNDVKLAQKFPQIDLILGGHDHLIVHQKCNNSIIVKSGTNFKNFSYVQIYPVEMKNSLQKGETKPYQQKYIYSNSKIVAKITLAEVNHIKTKIQPDLQLHTYVESLYGHFRQRQQRIGCYFLQDVDLRFTSIRKQQNAYLQFLVSLYRHYTKAQCAFLNGGNFRADTYIPAGPVTYGLLTNIMEDQIVVKKVIGRKLILGLEVCVSMYPNLSGRYSTFSGIQFTWDCSRKPFERVLATTVRINGKPLRLQKIYRVAMHGFVAKGGDGFTVFKDCDVDHDHFHNNNLLLVNDLLAGSEKLLAGFAEKYPNTMSYKIQNGERILVLHVPSPRNVKMIGEHSTLLQVKKDDLSLRRSRILSKSKSREKRPSPMKVEQKSRFSQLSTSQQKKTEEVATEDNKAYMLFDRNNEEQNHKLIRKMIEMALDEFQKKNPIVFPQQQSNKNS